MKTDIHPIYFSQAKVTCACGNSFVTGSTVETIAIEICSACHPFFTGKSKLMDTAGRVDKFKTRMQFAEDHKAKQPRSVKAKTAELIETEVPTEPITEETTEATTVQDPDQITDLNDDKETSHEE